MLGVLCARPRWLLSSSLSFGHGGAAASFSRLFRSQFHLVAGDGRLDQSIRCPERYSGAASVWHTILPSYWRRRSAVFSRLDNDALKRGEGSWNVAWDARPARWLHHANSAWILFGVCAATPFIDSHSDLKSQSEVLVPIESLETEKYKITGVTADGRCLFRAIAHLACLKNGGTAPDDNRQRELADELRAKVVEELLNRRKEVEWSIDEDFDTYLQRIEQPYTWGGEPELVMCSHVLRTSICVFMKDKSSDNLVQIASYGQEYRRYDGNSINVLFHGYGHYDILEFTSCSS